MTDTKKPREPRTPEVIVLRNRKARSTKGSHYSQPQVGAVIGEGPGASSREPRRPVVS